MEISLVATGSFGGLSPPNRFQPAVTNLTKLFLAVTQPLDLTCHITRSSSLKHTHAHTQQPV